MANAYLAKNRYDYCNNNIYNRDNRRLLHMQSQRKSLRTVLTKTRPI